MSKTTLLTLCMATNSIRKIAIDPATKVTESIFVQDSGLEPDGIVADHANDKVYWTVMGQPKKNDGSIVSATLDGKKSDTVIPRGKTFTPKQIRRLGDMLYWADREGGRIQRCKTDGTSLETIYDSAPGQDRPLADATKWCVGIAIDAGRGLIYWTQKGPTKGGKGAIFRSRLSDPSKIQTLLENLPEPVQLELDPSGENLYWTDRGQPPLGDSLNRITVIEKFDPSAPAKRISDVDVIVKNLHEPIGLTGDWTQDRFYVAEIDGSVWAIDLADGCEPRKTMLITGGSYTGIIQI